MVLSLPAARSARGRSAAYRTVRLASSGPFDSLGAARVELRIADGNVKSRRLAERLGFALDGVLRAETRDNSGALSDMRVYSVLNLAALRDGR